MCKKLRADAVCVVGPLLRVLVSVFAPVYWNTVLENGAARNGYSFTQGQFRQESQLEFETGELCPPRTFVFCLFFLFSCIIF